MKEEFLIAVGILILAGLIYYVLREFNCWYWKINQRIEVQRRTNDLLEQLVENTKNNPKLKAHKPAQDSISSDVLNETGSTDVNDPGVMDEILKRVGKNPSQ